MVFGRSEEPEKQNMNANQIRWSHPSYYHFKNNSFGSKTFLELLNEVSGKFLKNGAWVKMGNVTAVLPEGVKVISHSVKNGTNSILYEVDVPSTDPLADIW